MEKTAVLTEAQEETNANRLSMYIYILPNLVTILNLLCGFFAIIQAFHGNYLIAAYAIVAAAIFDQLDGRLARLTRSTSKFGAELDSICDVVSFGVAPALLLYEWALQPFGRIGWVACFLYVACGALRLARFNVQVNVVEKAYFQGLPIPMAAGIVASSVIAYIDLAWESQGSWLLLFMTVLCALVMVSTFRYRSFKDIDLKQRLPFRYLLLGVGVIVVVASRWEVMLFVLFMTYATIGAVFGIFRLGKVVRRKKPNNYDPDPTYEPELIEEFDEDEEPKK